jgi:putative GTP pyrophosphokinase
MQRDFTRFIMEYRFAVDEVLTKVTILREEFLHLHRYNPIEHVSSRVKSPESILRKVVRKGCEPTLPAIRRNITDIAGIRITCSFIADTYRMLDALTSQSDLRVIEIRDYIAHPKPNGYKSLHVILEIPVPVHRAGRGDRRGADPDDRDGLLGQPGAQDLLQVRR